MVGIFKSHKLTGSPAAFTMLAGVFCLFFILKPSARAATPKPVCRPEMAAVMQVFAEQLPAEWHPQHIENGDVQLNNPMHGFRFRIHQEGIEIRSAKGFALGLQLVRFGFSGAMKKPQPSKARIMGARVELSHDPDLVEWFLNTPAGVEQGFRLMRAPREQNGHSVSQAPNIFELVFNLRGELIPELSAEGLILKDKSGHIRMHYNQLLAYDAGGRVLPAQFGLKQNQLSISVNTAEAVYPVIIDPLFSSEQPLKAADENADDQFGSAVAVDADTIVVAAPLVDSLTAVDTGAVYVYVREPATGVFSQQQKVTAPDAAADDRFGSAIDVDGNTLVVGAPLVDSLTAVDTGAVYVFTRDPAVATNPWTFQQKLFASDAKADDRLGSAVYADGNTLVAGAPRVDTLTANDTGAAYVFARDPDDNLDPWVQQQKLTASDAAADDQLGTSVSLYGNTIVVGAPLVDSLTAVDIGAVYVFTRDQSLGLNAWIQEPARLVAGNARADDRFGSAVSLDGNTIIIGAPLADLTGATDAGTAYIFTRNLSTQAFVQDQILNASDPDSMERFGSAVFVHGSTALVDAPFGDVLTAADTGRVFAFMRGATTGNWSQQQLLTGAIEALAQFGNAVALDGVTAVIGQKLKNQGTASNAGAAFVYTLEPLANEIAQETDVLNASAAASFDNFGDAVGLSADNAIIGIPLADPGITNNAGAASGFVRDPATQTFDQEETLTASDNDNLDEFGSAVSVDGDTAVIGAPLVDLPGAADAGAAYVFGRNLDTGMWDQSVKLTAEPDEAAGDEFGRSVAADGDIIIVGAPLSNPGGTPDAGAVFIFSRSPVEAAADQWSRTTRLTAGPDVDMLDQFGFSVSIRADTALIGAPFENNGGAVFVFVRDPDDNSWSRQQKLKAFGAAPGDQFGFSVSVYGNTAVIGAPSADVTGVVNAGAVYVFRRDPSDTTNPWSQAQKLNAFDAFGGDAFGTAVALAGNTAIIGAPGADLPGTAPIVFFQAGAAYDFRRDPGSGLFRHRSKLTASDAAAGDAFGSAVIVTCDTIIIGAPLFDPFGPALFLLTDAGVAFIFQTFPSQAGSANGATTGGSSCFIDTAVSGSVMHPAVYAISILTLVAFAGCRKVRKYHK